MPLPNPKLTLFTTGANGAAPAGFRYDIPDAGSSYETGVALGSVVITWGRESVGKRIDPATMQFLFHDPTGLWGRSRLRVGSPIYCRIPQGATEADWKPMFQGRISDIDADPVSGNLLITCVDMLADWAQFIPGGSPFLAQSLSTRMSNLRVRAGTTYTQGAYPTNTPSISAAPMAGVVMDRQPLRRLIDDLFDSVDCVVYLTAENVGSTLPTLMVAKRRRDMTGLPTITRTPAAFKLEGRYTQRVSNLLSRVTIGYWEGTGSAPLALTYTQSWSEQISAFGDRTHSIQTMLRDLAGEYGPSTLATELRSRLGFSYWELPTLTTTEALLNSDADALVLLDRKTSYEKQIHLTSFPGDLPLPPTGVGADEAFLRVIGTTARHDGKQWTLSMSCVQHASTAQEAPPWPATF